MALRFDKVTAGTAIAHLYRRFPVPEWFAAHELQVGSVPTPGGTWQDRRADFVALRLWGNRPGHLLGFEVKVSRQDFLHELAQPDKREPLEALCAACYFVAPSGVLSVRELPEGWGWLELQANGLRMRHEAKHTRNPNSSLVYHALMKRVIDDSWHRRPVKPALADWDKALFSHLGMDLTPGQLTALAQKIFWQEREAMVAGVRAEAKAEAKRAHDLLLKERDALRRILADAIGIDAWRTDMMTLEEMRLALLSTKGGNSVDLHRALKSTRLCLDRLCAAVAQAEDAIAPESEGVKP